MISASINEDIFVRITNDTDDDITGVLSIFKGTSEQGDLCTNAIPIDVGTCDFDFNVGARFFNNEGMIDDASCTGFTFDPALSTNNDGWLTFTSTAIGRIGLEYTNIEADAAIEIYEGSCGNLTFVNTTCTNGSGNWHWYRGGGV